MNANDAHFVPCRDGVFFIPESLQKSLAMVVKNGFVYLRQDRDTMTISTTRITDGQRRILKSRFRAPMFRDATRLAIVDLQGALQVMAVV
jgi:hypothetical protein